MSATVDRASPLPIPTGAPDRPIAAWARSGVLVAGGVALSSAVAAAAFGAREIIHVAALSPIVLAMALGMGIRSIFGAPGWAQAGIAFAARRLMRLAIILLGLQITAAQVAGVGATGFLVIGGTLVAAFAFTTWTGRLLGVAPGLTQLIAAGTSICGASAIAATNTVTRAEDEDVAYAIACVTLFGSIAMLVYPMTPVVLGLDDGAYGLWTGATIHEVAQVVGAGFGVGTVSGEAAVVAKLTRVMMLAPVVATLCFLASRRGATATGSAPFPWFVLGFGALVGLNSVVTVPAEAKSAAGVAATALLTVSLAAMGLGADISKLKSKGPRPFVLGLAATAFIAGFGLVLVKLTG